MGYTIRLKASSADHSDLYWTSRKWSTWEAYGYSSQKNLYKAMRLMLPTLKPTDRKRVDIVDSVTHLPVPLPTLRPTKAMLRALADKQGYIYQRDMKKNKVPRAVRMYEDDTILRTDVRLDLCTAMTIDEVVKYLNLTADDFYKSTEGTRI
jgi:hypothetical protein